MKANYYLKINKKNFFVAIPEMIITQFQVTLCSKFNLVGKVEFPEICLLSLGIN